MKKPVCLYRLATLKLWLPQSFACLKIKRNGRNSDLKDDDDLTRVRGIGKVMEKKLHELGIRNLHQLAELGPADIHRINAAIDFPGRVEREQWVEQARTMVAAG